VSIVDFGEATATRMAMKEFHKLQRVFIFLFFSSRFPLQCVCLAVHPTIKKLCKCGAMRVACILLQHTLYVAVITLDRLVAAMLLPGKLIKMLQIFYTNRVHMKRDHVKLFIAKYISLDR
jgi:hypothetical protein